MSLSDAFVQTDVENVETERWQALVWQIEALHVYRIAVMVMQPQRILPGRYDRKPQQGLLLPGHVMTDSGSVIRQLLGTLWLLSTSSAAADLCLYSESLLECLCLRDSFRGKQSKSKLAASG